ncbi:MAG: class I SAM-dependent methyltransferase [Deltaproteobacteria bacterium]|nr:class I SAM-dependent methyltransferase [Deltaproteobacteria bacterium]
MAAALIELAGWRWWFVVPLALAVVAFAMALRSGLACVRGRPRPEGGLLMFRPYCILAAVVGCSSHGHGHNHGHGHDHGTYANAESWAQRFDDPARDAWQLPDEVLRAMELTPAMVVADVGAGTGYFAVRLARAVPQGEVIATDVEPEMVRYLGERARREQLPNLRAVRATPTASGLAAGSVDAILIVHVWHHVRERAPYVRDLAAALRPGGRVFIVDFSPDAPKGPPAHMRLSAEQVVAELAGAGLTARVSPVALPDQYLVEARREP